MRLSNKFVLAVAAAMVTIPTMASMITPTNFNSINDMKPAENLKGLKFVSRLIVPYGPKPNEEHVQGTPLNGFGFGMVRFMLLLRCHAVRYRISIYLSVSLNTLIFLSVTLTFYL